MVKVKLNSFSEKTKEFDFVENERLSELFKRFCAAYNFDHKKQKEYFKIFIEGEEVHQDLWTYIKPKSDATVLIVLVPKSGDSGRILGQIALTVAIIAVNATFGPYWAAATAIIGALAINQLFPPPALDLGGANKAYNQEESQMYSITGQSNQVKKYGYVPKVYGEHRIFPNVAANPYTEYEVKNGELVQYLYAVYDLGLGPLIVRDIKIGDSEVELFEDVSYRLVDFNRPGVSEGSWDDALNTNLAFYKGDNNIESVSAAINDNQNDSGVVEDDYTVIRNADENPNNLEQEIILDFGFPQGLTTLGSNGVQDARTVELDVQFAEVGTNNWRAYNNENYVSSFSAVGESVVVDTKNIELLLVKRSNPFVTYHPYYDILSRKYIPYYKQNQYPIDDFNFFGGYFEDGIKVYEDRYGIKKGATSFWSTTYINVGDYIRYGNEIVGRVSNRQQLVSSPVPGYRYSLYSPAPYDIYLYRDFTKFNTDNSANTSWYYDNKTTTPPYSGAPLKIENNTSGIFRIRSNKSVPVFASLRFTPRTSSQVKIRVRRVRSYGGYTYRVFDEMAWTTLTTRFDTVPINTDKRHVFLELKIRATDQLNGTIKNLSATCSSVLDVYDPNTGTWSKEESANPAWVFADILTGNINKRPISKLRLDTDSLVEWANFCDEIPTAPGGRIYFAPRFTSNFISDVNITVSQLISQITSTAQASMNIINGKYGVLVDKLKTVPVQVFTPRNSWNFSSTRTYSNLPDAVKVKYVDPGREWGVYEEIVYNDGFDINSAETFEELNAFACTNYEQAWRLGRYFLVSSLLRQENITIDVDFEHLVCTRGDYVKLQHDVMKVGGTPARIKTVVGNVVTIDDSFFTEVGVNYGYTFRGVNGVFTGTMTILDSSSAELDNDIPSVGDLFVWGEVEKITIDCLVKAITPNDDLSASVLLIEKADEVYDAESTSTLPIYDPQLTENISDLTPPGAVENLSVVESSQRCGAGDYIYYVQLSWDSPTGSIVEQYEIYVDRGDGFELVDYSTLPVYEYVVDSDYLNIDHSFKIIGVAANGAKLGLADVPFVSDTPLVKSALPSDVTALYINITNESLQLDWDQVSDCDIENYLIRYSPNLNASWSSSIPLQVVDKNTSLATFQARVGAYFIKAIDWAGNESANAATAITSIPALTNINVIEETNDFPDLLGVLDQVQKFGNELILKEKTSAIPGVIEYFEDGYYYYENLLDLGEIYTVRLQSLIEAEGFSIDDLMVNWTTLADVDALSGASVSDWDVETQYRATNNYNVMSEWVTLAGIDPISEGVQTDFTDWRKFTIGDFTGRIFQFRLKLKSNNPNVTPRVFDGVIKADMPDRVENYNNLNTTSGEYSLTYLPAFKGPGTTPNIQITQDAAQQGDYYQLSNKTLEGFTIKFYDKDNNLVDRQFDVLVKGYGRKQNEVI